MDGFDPREFDAERLDIEAPAEARSHARLFEIAAGTPFLRELVRALCDGRLVPGFKAQAGDPLALASATIYVPTRRAARELRATFVTEFSAGGTARAAILPTIRALGDVDDEAGFFEEAVPELLDLAPPIGSSERIVSLARLVRAWIKTLPQTLDALHGGDRIEVPSSPADAIWLARDLCKLMDEMERQGTDWRDLVEIDAGEHALWWQLTLQFLSIVTEAWPAHLIERDRSNPAAHANAAIRGEAKRLRDKGSDGPVIVAVSPLLGPATIELVEAVARLPNGAVILPGLDRTLTEAEYGSIARANPTRNAASVQDERAPGHPQFGHGHLLAHLHTKRDDVTRLGELTDACTLRERALCEALRPAETTHRWAETLPDMHETGNLDRAFEDVDVIEAPGAREEALAIAAVLREAIETSDRTAALVTPDRALARRVTAELRRFGIEADDSAGIPLLSTQAGAFLRLVLAAALEPSDPRALLGMLKHPLARFGLSRSAVRRATLVIELVALRTGAPGPVDPLALSDLFEAKLAALDAEGARVPFWRPRFDDEAIAEARDLIARVADALRQLSEAKTHGMSFPPSVWAGFIGTVLDLAGEDEEGGFDAIYATPDGAVLARALRELMTIEDVAEDGNMALSLDIAPDELVGAVEALLAELPVRRPAGGHPRVSILGLIESRLLSPDTVVLGGLNEGVWPTQTTTDQFLSRPMREVLSLEPPERRIGLEAHDMFMMMGVERVILTRSLRAEGSPTSPSRWLQRLETVLRTNAEDGTSVWDAMRERGAMWLDHVHEIDRRPAEDRTGRPAPTPPITVRPTRLSVTEIETLRRDPYAVYAKRILRLEPLEEPRGEPDYAERGTLFHAIVQRFVEDEHDPEDDAAMEALYAIAREEFDRLALPPETDRKWWARFEGMAERYLSWERERAPRVERSYVEASGFAKVDDETALSGRADRIDLMRDGTVEIIDYKTGTVPSNKQVLQLLSPQLPLEAAMIARGAFREIGRAKAGSLRYVHLKPKTKRGSDTSLEETKVGDDTRAAYALGEKAWKELVRLLKHYRDPLTPYPSRIMPMREGDMDGAYDHLARVREWSTGEGDDDGGDEGGGDA